MGLKPICRNTTSFSALTLLVGSFDSCVHCYAHTHEQFLQLTIGLGVSLDLGLPFVFCHSFPMLFAFVVLDLISSALNQEIGWEACL